MFETLLSEWVEDFELTRAKKEASDSKSKKEDYISSLEDFIELVSALCPNEEELIKHKGNELIKKFNNL